MNSKKQRIKKSKSTDTFQGLEECVLRSKKIHGTFLYPNHLTKVSKYIFSGFVIFFIASSITAFTVLPKQANSAPINFAQAVQTLSEEGNNFLLQISNYIKRTAQVIFNTINTTADTIKEGASSVKETIIDGTEVVKDTFQKPPQEETQPQLSPLVIDGQVTTQEDIIESPNPSLQNELNKLKQQIQILTFTPTLPPNIVEKTIGRVVSGVVTTQDLVDLENELRKEIFRIQGGDTNSSVQSNFRAIALINKIDQLAKVSLVNTTVSGTFSGLTDAHIPDTITATNYLLTTGGTISSNLSILGNFTVTGAQTFYDALNVPSITATSTTIASSFIQASTTRLSVFDTAYFGGTATSTFDSTGALTLNALSYFNSGFISSASSTVAAALNTLHLFASSTAYIDGQAIFGGNVGIGTTSPYTALAVVGSTGVLADIFTATSTTATSTFAGGLIFETSGLVYDFSSNNVGIGVVDPDVALEVFKEISGSQFKISYDATTNTTFQVDSLGDLIVNPSGDDIFFNSENLWICSGGCPAGTPLGTGNLIVETSLGIASSTPWGGVFQYELAVDGDVIITGTTTIGNNFSFAPTVGITTEIGLFDASGNLMLIFDEQ